MLDEVVGCLGGWVFEFAVEAALEMFDVFSLFTWRAWVTLGLAGLGVFAISRAFADAAPVHPLLLYFGGASLVVGPFLLFVVWDWPNR
ncbi:hypothetical protein [Longimicrobium sp.]|uniref:hypothetical protein n=1 Tax=Longimicrobium sp. TaxID=2029185 RepID=UPI002F93F3AB